MSPTPASLPARAPHRRILSLWFPRLGADRILRQDRGGITAPLAVTEEVSNMQVISSLSAAAENAGLLVGQSLRDAHAVCAHLVARSRNRPAEQAFLAALQRWAAQFSPWVAAEGEDALVLDLTGCAHLFGGEAALVARIDAECAAMGVSVALGLADTRGAAWALARFVQGEVGSDRSGDAIQQEARATRARAQPSRAGAPQKGKGRHWTRGGTAPDRVASPAGQVRIAPPGQTYGALAPLPVAALRLDPAMVAQLNRLGLRQIGDLLGQPRAALARRFGRGLVLRLDQAMGSAPEPISPARAPDHFAVRLTLPEPIGLMSDLLAALDRMLPQLCARLEARGKGARVLRLEAQRTDQAAEVVEVTLARPSRTPARIRPLLAMKLEQLDAGFGIDQLRLQVLQAEPLHGRRQVGHLEAGARARAADHQLADVLGRLGARVGTEALTRYHPVETHVPEKTAQLQAAAWSEAVARWPHVARPRPVLLWPPELVQAQDVPELDACFRWRGRDWHCLQREGPERIAPEWWLDDPNWRSGVRDYWRVVTEDGQRLWLYFAHGAALSRGWFCQGSFG
ncbi:DNA polymerase Y family protein [Tritonibacter litoralis]|uniref:Y-family DNA polymerase n=1 Tax=Tritonibacter litoralis TaxID=2662264 RepID=UPI0031B6371F